MAFPRKPKPGAGGPKKPLRLPDPPCTPKPPKHPPPPRPPGPGDHVWPDPLGPFRKKGDRKKR